MTVRAKQNKWYVDFQTGGTRYREFGFSRYQDAAAWEAQAREAIRKGKPLPPSPSDARPASGVSAIRTIGELCDHVVKIRWCGMKSRASEATGRLFVAWAGPLVPVDEALSVSSIHEYVEYMQDERQCSGSTINRRLSAVSRLAKTAVSLGLLEKAPEMPWQKEGEGRIRWFATEDEEKMFSTLLQWGQHEERDLFIFLVDTGARLGEATKLTWKDISSHDKAVTFWETKAGNHRTVPLTGRAKEAIARRRAERKPGQEGPFTDINRNALRTLWERLRTHHEFIGDTVVHTFRHTCASRLVQKGVDLMRVRMWMGHKAIQTTLRYAHLAPKHLDDVLKALEAR